jgi:hypothetical protein
MHPAIFNQIKLFLISWSDKKLLLGPGSIDWCEPNYVYSDFIAEYWVNDIFIY